MLQELFTVLTLRFILGTWDKLISFEIFFINIKDYLKEIYLVLENIKHFLVNKFIISFLKWRRGRFLLKANEIRQHGGVARVKILE